MALGLTWTPERWRIPVAISAVALLAAVATVTGVLPKIIQAISGAPDPQPEIPVHPERAKRVEGSSSFDSPPARSG